MYKELEPFKTIILDDTDNVQILKSDKVKRKLKIRFIDNSILYVREISFDKTIIDYSYQWLDYEMNLIIRWDNTDHYPDITTFPHHKHILDNSNVHPSDERTLNEVLQYIYNQIHIN